MKELSHIFYSQDHHYSNDAARHVEDLPITPSIIITNDVLYPPKISLISFLSSFRAFYLLNVYYHKNSAMSIDDARCILR